MINITAPSSKSLSHRVLVASAMADGESLISNVLESDDTDRTREMLESLGAVFTRGGPGEYRVRGLAGRIRGPEFPPAREVFVGESGATCRLGMALLAAGQGLFRLSGSERMHVRPVEELADALGHLGTVISYEENHGYLPLKLRCAGFHAPGRHGTPRTGITCEESSQYLSGLLMAAPLGCPDGLLISLDGRRVVSWPYVALTLDTLERFGVAFSVQHLHEGQWIEADWKSLTNFQPGEIRFRVYGDAYTAGRYSVEGDWSGASYFLAAGAVGREAVRVTGLSTDSMQADAAIRGILRRMGARVEDEDERSVTVYPSSLRGIHVTMGNCPDLVPTVAAMAFHASGQTEIREVPHLALKESDRIAALAQELRTAGCTVEELPDGLRIRPPVTRLQGDIRGRSFSCHNDHRLAMSLALLGLSHEKDRPHLAVALDQPACVNKSFPDFWEQWERVLREG